MYRFESGAANCFCDAVGLNFGHDVRSLSLLELTFSPTMLPYN